jgi:hypothetical protein
MPSLHPAVPPLPQYSSHAILPVQSDPVKEKADRPRADSFTKEEEASADQAYSSLRQELGREVFKQKIGLQGISNQGGYIGDIRLDEILTDGAVKSAVLSSFPGSARKLVAVILLTFERRLDGQRAIQGLLECGYNDAKLPLTEKDYDRLMSSDHAGFSSTCGCDANLRGFHDSPWRENHLAITDFRNKQSPFCVANFQDLDADYVFEVSTLLPFQYDEHKHHRASTFCKVIRTRMLSTHQNVIPTVNTLATLPALLY